MLLGRMHGCGAIRAQLQLHKPATLDAGQHGAALCKAVPGVLRCCRPGHDGDHSACAAEHQSPWVWMLRLKLADATGQLDALLFSEDGTHFFQARPPADSPHVKRDHIQAWTTVRLALVQPWHLRSCRAHEQPAVYLDPCAVAPISTGIDRDASVFAVWAQVASADRQPVILHWKPSCSWHLARCGLP